MNILANLNIFDLSLIGLGKGVSVASDVIIKILSSILQFEFPEDHENVSLSDCISDLCKTFDEIIKNHFLTPKAQKNFLLDELQVLKDFIKAVLNMGAVPDPLRAAILDLRTGIGELEKNDRQKRILQLRVEGGLG